VRLQRVLADENHRVLMATDSAGEVIGGVHIQRLMSLDADLSGQILGLVVAEKARRHGVGRALMTAAEDWARGRKCTKVILRSNVKRVDAHAFYEGIGYSNAKTQFAFRKLI
jgi:GNAT superfamily N-acetyltransferase